MIARTKSNRPNARPAHFLKRLPLIQKMAQQAFQDYGAEEREELNAQVVGNSRRLAASPDPRSRSLSCVSQDADTADRPPFYTARGQVRRRTDFNPFRRSGMNSALRKDVRGSEARA